MNASRRSVSAILSVTSTTTYSALRKLIRDYTARVSNLIVQCAYVTLSSSLSLSRSVCASRRPIESGQRQNLQAVERVLAHTNVFPCVLPTTALTEQKEAMRSSDNSKL